MNNTENNLSTLGKRKSSLPKSGKGYNTRHKFKDLKRVDLGCAKMGDKAIYDEFRISFATDENDYIMKLNRNDAARISEFFNEYLDKK